jgi:dihydroorotase
MPKLLIKNALAIDPRRGFEAKLDLLIAGGRIESAAAGLAPQDDGTSVYDASGLWLMPGIIDMHVHTREPGMERAENLSSAAAAAAAGGITSILAMPNTEPPADNPALIRRLSAKAAGLPVNVYFSAAVTLGRAGRGLADLKALKTAGALAFTDDGACVSDSGLLKRALRLAKALKIPLLEHAESLSLTGAGVMHRCDRARRLNLPGIPREAEVFMVLRDLLAARSAGAALHLQHLSCLESVELVAAAKKAGIKVTAETCPHYFTLTCGDVRSAAFKMKPPLREPADRAALKKALACGDIDVIASDHAPHTEAAKKKGLLKAPFGVIGLETMLGLALTELVHTGRLSRLRLAEVMSANPARILGLVNKGGLSPGMDADLTLINPRAEYSVGRGFYSKSSNSPFIGRRLKGRAAATIVGGRFVFKAGRLASGCAA